MVYFNALKVFKSIQDDIKMTSFLTWVIQIMFKYRVAIHISNGLLHTNLMLESVLQIWPS